MYWILLPTTHFPDLDLYIRIHQNNKQDPNLPKFRICICATKSKKWLFDHLYLLDCHILQRPRTILTINAVFSPFHVLLYSRKCLLCTYKANQKWSVHILWLIMCHFVMPVYSPVFTTPHGIFINIHKCTYSVHIVHCCTVFIEFWTYI